MAGHDEDLIRNHSFMLGEINGSLKALHAGQERVLSAVQSVDGRLRTVESKSIRNGLIAGGAMGVATLLLKETVKSALGIKS